MLKDAPDIKTVMPNFLNFIQGSCLCTYNAEFDLGFLNNELKLIGLPVINNIVVLDVLIMARKLIPNLPKYALWFVAQHLQVKSTQQHRALADVELTWEVFTKFKVICQQKGITSFTDFSQNFSYKPKP